MLGVSHCGPKGGAHVAWSTLTSRPWTVISQSSAGCQSPRFALAHGDGAVLITVVGDTYKGGRKGGGAEWAHHGRVAVGS